MTKELAGQLDRLEALVREKAPVVLSGLRPRAKPAALDRLAVLFDGSLPEELEAWYSWHDGERGDSEGILPRSNWVALSCADVVKVHRLQTGRHGAALESPWNPSWVPLFGDAEGNYLCLDRRSGELRSWYHDAASRPTPHKSLRQLFDRLEATYARMKKPASLPAPPPRLHWQACGVPTTARVKRLPVGTVFLASTSSYRLMRVKLADDRWLECSAASIPKCLDDWKAMALRPPSASSGRYGTDFSVWFELKSVGKEIRISLTQSSARGVVATGPARGARKVAPRAARRGAGP